MADEEVIPAPRERNAGYTNQEYADMLVVYGACNQVGRAAAAEYQRRFPNRRHPDAGTFTRVYQRLAETGSVQVRNPDGGRRRGARAANDEAILDCFAEDPTTSLRRTARFIGTSYSTCQRVMKEDGQHAFKYRRVHEILEGDREQRLIFSNVVVEEHQRDPGFLDRILWTDEATYGRTGMMNAHNQHYWAHENPHLAREDRFQNRFSINIWAGLIGDQLIGPFEMPERLDGPNYLNFLQVDLPVLLDAVLTPEQQQNIIFQHDGAPAHFALDVRNHLDNVFPERWIGRGGPTPWPARSPDFNPLDYFFWGYSKEQVYHNGAPANEELLRDRIREHATNVPNIMVQRATRDILRRARACIREEGGPFEHCQREERARDND